MHRNRIYAHVCVLPPPATGSMNLHMVLTSRVRLHVWQLKGVAIVLSTSPIFRAVVSFVFMITRPPMPTLVCMTQDEVSPHTCDEFFSCIAVHAPLAPWRLLHDAISYHQAQHFAKSLRAGDGKHIGVMCRLGVMPAIRRLSGGARKSVSRMLASFKGLDLCSQSVRKRVSEIWWPSTVLGLGSLCVIVGAAMLWNERQCRSS